MNSLSVKSLFTFLPILQDRHKKKTIEENMQLEQFRFIHIFKLSRKLLFVVHNIFFSVKHFAN